MFEAQEKDLNKILMYLKTGIQDCIYMYIDIKKYGLSNPAMKVWYDSDISGDLSMVVMKYHTSISFYSENNDSDLKGVVELIKEYGPNSISAKRVFVEKLYTEMDDVYNVTYGHIVQLLNYPDLEKDDIVETAKDKDMLEIARLIVSDEHIGNYYDVNDLAEQFIERRNSSMGRNYIIKEHGKIVGHTASYAELDNIAVAGGLIVDPTYKGDLLLGPILEGYIIRQMIKEGFTLFGFVTPKRSKILVRFGNKFVAEYGKLTKEADN